jgi:uncharacterized protein YbgA (DUF1722 family)/uncharacterized protein YbbK (DUF523 family)
MPDFPRPTVVISRCIDFDSCRYNGQVIRASLREELEPHVQLEPICPELEVGLGVPRDPVRIVVAAEGERLVQPSTGRDLTASMRAFANRYLGAVSAADGFILKSRSPSCAIVDAKRYRGDDGQVPAGTGPGMFAATVRERFRHAAIEDESRLNDLRLREHFLTKLFALAGLRAVIATGLITELVGFHARNTLLLMAYSQARMRALERIVENPGRAGFTDVARSYREQLAAALARPARMPANANVLTHALEHCSQHLSAAERAHFLDLLEGYRHSRLPLSALKSVLSSWAARLGVEYLAGQTFVAPFPAALVRPAPAGHELRRASL